MRINELFEDQCTCEVFIDERWVKAKRCLSPKKLGNSDRSQCVSRGLIPHYSKGKGHTDGKGNYVKGKKIKGVKYGGPLK
jgi:hypothetical protein